MAVLNSINPPGFCRRSKKEVTCREELAAGNIINNKEQTSYGSAVADDMPGIFADNREVSDYSQTEYQQGEKVKHPDFGAGEVIAVKRENNGDEQVTVKFDDGKEKSLMVKYAPLQKQN